MRYASAGALLLCLLIPPAAAQQSEAPDRANLLTRWLDEADIHPPARVGRLTVFPIVVASTPRLTGVLTMDQALRKGLLVVEELASAQVSKARFVNKSGDQMIFLMAGEVITGGKQNRTLTTDALLKPDSSTVLDLYCVQQGRWVGKKGFARHNTIAPQAVRERAAQKAGQNEVWTAVGRANRRMGAANDSGDLNVAMTKPDNVRKLAELRRPIVAKLPAGTAGVVVAYGGRVVGADLFNSAELFGAMRDKVLNSYLSQYALGEAIGVRGGGRAAGCTAYDVRDYLQACYQASFTAGEVRGVGRVYHVRGARHGETLAYQGVVPVRRAKRSSRIVRHAKPYMVHTALMRRVVAVRPVPVPVPRPPVRPLPQPRPRR